MRYAMALTLVASGVTLLALPSGAEPGDQPVTGTVYRDANADGVRQPSEGGQPGVTVSATDTTGASVSTTSGPNGTYSLGVSALGAGPFRIEFSGWDGHLEPGPHGAGDPTSVSVAQAGAKVDFGVLDPDDYCQADPELVVSCFVSGAPGGAGLETVASFPYSAGATETSAHDTTKPAPAGADAPDETKLAELGQTGSVYGEGWHRGSSSLYLAAFTKKYVPFGPSGSGAIYVRHGNGAPTLFYSTGSSSNRSVSGGDWYRDPWTDEVGKVGWGDIDVIGDQLFAVNLEDRHLYVFDLDPATGAMRGGGPSARVAIPALASVPDDSRPFGLGSRDGILYVGGVDSAQSGGTPTAWVVTFDPSTSSFSPTPVAQFSLAYPRGCAFVAKTGLGTTRCAALDGGAAWRAWSATPSSADAPDIASGRVVRTQVDPQPELSDIAFDDAGNMSLGFRDRFGDQSGRFIPAGTVPNALSPTGTWPLYLTSYTMGDTLRLARTGTAAWTLESNGTSGGVTGTAGDGLGPGGGEFYDADNSLYRVLESGIQVLEGHDEVTMGALHHQPGTPQLATTAYDVFGRWDTLGVRFMTDTGDDAPHGGDSTDLNVRAYSLSTGTFGGTSPFGKANGLGDLEALCDRAPIEIGNYVWFDTDRDGVQDATEKPIPGVTVTLRDASKATLATATTDVTGQYWFVSADAPNLPATPGPSYGVVADGIEPDTTYSLTFDVSTADTSGIGVAPGDLVITTAGQGTPTTGSKPTASGGGLPTVTVHTGGAGANDHTFDAGYQPAEAPAISLVKSVNGEDADTAPGPTVAIGDPVAFTYLVTNSGSVTLDDIALSDDQLGAVQCPKSTLVAGESMTCTAADTAVAGQYVNVGTVTGSPLPGGPDVTASDSAHYVGQTASVLDVTTTVPAPPSLARRDAPTGVRDATQVHESPLPRTGTDTRGVLLVGLGLIISGMGLLVTTRRTARRPALS
jgi:hypothetical protein